MKFLICLVLAMLFINDGWGQKAKAALDTSASVYKGIQTRKFYNVGTGLTIKDGVTIYRVNDKEVDKQTYDKYHSTWVNMATCKPCILKAYDINDKLFRISVEYTDCPVGFEIEYFPDGKIKHVGHFKENATGNWNNLYDRGFCRKDGIWTYFDESGKKIKTEVYKDDKLVTE